jgi:hypothetical protein
MSSVDEEGGRADGCAGDLVCPGGFSPTFAEDRRCVVGMAGRAATDSIFEWILHGLTRSQGGYYSEIADKSSEISSRIMGPGEGDGCGAWRF